MTRLQILYSIFWAALFLVTSFAQTFTYLIRRRSDPSDLNRQVMWFSFLYTVVVFAYFVAFPFVTGIGWLRLGLIISTAVIVVVITGKLLRKNPSLSYRISSMISGIVLIGIFLAIGLTTNLQLWILCGVFWLGIGFYNSMGEFFLKTAELRLHNLNEKNINWTNATVTSELPITLVTLVPVLIYTGRFGPALVSHAIVLKLLALVFLVSLAFCVSARVKASIASDGRRAREFNRLLFGVVIFGIITAISILRLKTAVGEEGQLWTLDVWRLVPTEWKASASGVTTQEMHLAYTLAVVSILTFGLFGFSISTIGTAIKYGRLFEGIRPFPPRGLRLPGIPKIETSIPIIISVTATIGLIKLHESYPLSESEVMDFFNFTHFRYMLFERGFLPKIMIGTFLVSLLLLINTYWRKIRPLLSTHHKNNGLLEASKESMGEKIISILNERRLHPGKWVMAARHLLNRYESTPDEIYLRKEATTIVEGEGREIERALAHSSWCESALPLLGFTGTIVGMAGAISKLGSELLTSLSPNISTLRDGFSDVALAFETTFLGLAGAILLGGASHLARNTTEKHLEALREFLNRMLDTWAINSPVRELSASRLLNEHEYELFLEAVRKGDHPLLQAIDHVIFSPTVEFASEGGALQAKLTSNITNILGTDAWTFQALGINPEPDGDLGITAVHREVGDVLLVRINNQGDLVSRSHARGSYQLECPHNISRIICSKGARIVIVETDERKMLWTSWEEGRWQPLIQEEQEGRYEIKLLGSGSNGHETHLITLYSDGPLQRLVLDPINQDSTETMQTVLPTDYVWEKWGIDETTTTLFCAAVSHNMHDVIKMYRIRIEHGQLIQELVSESWQGGNVESVYALSPKQIMVLNDNGQVFTYDTERSGRFKNVTPHDWHQNNQVAAISYPYMAVLDHLHNLAMWRIEADRLVPYRDGAKQPRTFRVQGDTRSWCASANREKLYAVWGQALLTWTFPQCRADRPRKDKK
jgi:biopolymer transport protein ExbB/TolQ